MRISNRLVVASLLICALGCGPKGKSKSPGIIESTADDVGAEVDGAGQTVEGVGEDIGETVESAGETVEGVGEDVGETADDIVGSDDGAKSAPADESASPASTTSDDG